MRVAFPSLESAGRAPMALAEAAPTPSRPRSIEMPPGASAERLEAAFEAHAPASVQSLWRENAAPPSAQRFSLPSGAGQPLPDGLRTSAERFFRSDFSSVRLHVGPEAPSIGATAFTAGEQIVFAPGRLDLASGTGRRLLGHELAHVVQQRAGRVRHPTGSGLAVVDNPALEAEADRLGLAAFDSQATAAPGTDQAPAGGPAVQKGP